MNNGHSECQECGESLPRGRKPRLFCSPACRQKFNNRRLQHGAQFYDLFMSMRYERDTAGELGLWAVMCRLAAKFRNEDEAKRNGRKSWQPPSSVLERLPVVMREKDVYIKHGRFGRA